MTSSAAPPSDTAICSAWFNMSSTTCDFGDDGGGMSVGASRGGPEAGGKIMLNGGRAPRIARLLCGRTTRTRRRGRKKSGTCGNRTYRVIYPPPVVCPSRGRGLLVGRRTSTPRIRRPQDATIAPETTQRRVSGPPFRPGTLLLAQHAARRLRASPGNSSLAGSTLAPDRPIPTS